MAIDALIFDFDRVIMDAETPEIQTWQEVFGLVKLTSGCSSRVIAGNHSRLP